MIDIYRVPPRRGGAKIIRQRAQALFVAAVHGNIQLRIRGELLFQLLNPRHEGEIGRNIRFVADMVRNAEPLQSARERQRAPYRVPVRDAYA